jgi:hypothetical protein
MARSFGGRMIALTSTITGLFNIYPAADDECARSAHAPHERGLESRAMFCE